MRIEVTRTPNGELRVQKVDVPGNDFCSSTYRGHNPIFLSPSSPPEEIIRQVLEFCGHEATVPLPLSQEKR